MKKLLIITFLLFYSCTTTEKIVSSGKIRENISKSELMDAFLISYPSDDPFLPEGALNFFLKKTLKLFGVLIKRNFMFLKMFQNQFLVELFFAETEMELLYLGMTHWN